MSALGSGILIPGLLFVFTLLSGVWLSRSGRPLNALIFTAHKLFALAAVLLTGRAIYDLLRTAQAQPAVLLLIVFSGLSVLVLFVSGAFLSQEKPVNAALRTVHKVIPVLAAVSTSAIFYLMAPSR